MKHNINKMATIFIVSIFALSGLGMAYAAWTDTITVDGSVNTGELKWEFGPAPPTVTDVTGPPPYYPTSYPDWNCDPNQGFQGPYPQPFVVDKNVAYGQVLIVDPDNLQLNIYNAYPGYYNHLDFWVHALGTIPLKINSAIIKDVNGVVLATITHTGIYEFDISGDGLADMQINWGDEFGDQLHNGDQRDISFGFCFLQPLPQDSVITIYIGIVAVQWNEYPYSP